MPRVPPQQPRSVTALAEVIRLPSRRRVRDGVSTKELNETQQEALGLLLSGNGYEQVALALGVEESLVLGWVSFDKGFQDALLAAQGRSRKLVQLAVEQGAAKAANFLSNVLDGDAKYDIKLKAATVLLDRLRDTTDEPPLRDKDRDSTDPVAEALRRMGVSIPAGASAALAVRKDADGTVVDAAVVDVTPGTK
mgnify:CR=1 FL=1